MGAKIYKTMTVGAAAVLLGLTALAAASSTGMGASETDSLLVAPGPR